MALHALSLGLEIDIWKPQSGVVHSAFDHAVNLLIEGELWTVLGASRPDAPFGIRLAAGASPGGPDVRRAEPVHVRAGYMRMGPHVIDCRAAARWAPSRWRPPCSGLPARLAIVEREARLRAWPRSGEIAMDLTRGLCSSDAELAQAVRRSVGCGPGLTPAGDDVLTGMLAVLTSGACGSDVSAGSRLGAALAPVLHSTTDVSRHLLDQAARGLPGRALHDLGKALCEDTPSDVLWDTLALVLDTGSTSGADACLGLAAAFRLSFPAAERLVS